MHLAGDHARRLADEEAPGEAIRLRRSHVSADFDRLSMKNLVKYVVTIFGLTQLGFPRLQREFCSGYRGDCRSVCPRAGHVSAAQ